MSSNKESPSPFQGEGRGEGPSAHPRNLALVKPARRLRRQLTDTERKLWYHLRNRQFEGIKFRRQYPIGRYIVDFVSVEQSLIIELDGGQHADNQKDLIRDDWLRTQGYNILRFWNHEVLQNIEGVLETIQSYLSNPHPALSLKGRGEVEDFNRRDV